MDRTVYWPYNMLLVHGEYEQLYKSHVSHICWIVL